MVRPPDGCFVLLPKRTPKRTPTRTRATNTTNTNFLTLIFSSKKTVGSILF
jgi:hypothetical protein